MRHHLYGLVVDSEIPLGAEADPSGAPDVTIRWGATEAVGAHPPAGEPLAQRVVGGRTLYSVVSRAGATVIRFHGSCDVCISAEATEVVVACDPAFAPAMVPILLTGTVAALLLSLRGVHVLHGAAVERDGAAVGLVGPSGTGKSTLAALCCAGGARLVTDDLIPVDQATPPRLTGGWPEVRLRRSATGVADLFHPAPPSRVTPDGRLALSCPPSRCPRPRLAAVVLPRPRAGEAELVLRRLSRVEATFSLITADRIDEWRTPDRQQAQFESSARLALDVPTFVADVPWGPPFSPDLGRVLVERALAGAG